MNTNLVLHEVKILSTNTREDGILPYTWIIAVWWVGWQYADEHSSPLRCGNILLVAADWVGWQYAGGFGISPCGVDLPCLLHRALWCRRKIHLAVSAPLTSQIARHGLCHLFWAFPPPTERFGSWWWANFRYNQGRWGYRETFCAPWTSSGTMWKVTPCTFGRWIVCQFCGGKPHK